MIFVGERRSKTAQARGWSWADGRLAAKPLFEALRAMDVNPAAHTFVNLWTDDERPRPARATMTLLRSCRREKPATVVVALGRRVSSALVALDVDHVALVHPAARGRIRKRERYIAHVCDALRGPARREADAARRVIRIQSAVDEPGAHWIERYFLRDARGRPRELRRIPGDGQHAPGDGEILAWFRQLGVTHVEVADGWHETVPARTYALATFARHLRRVSRETVG